MLKHFLDGVCLEALWVWARPGMMAQGIPLDREQFLKGTLPVQLLIWQVPTMLQHGCAIIFSVAPSNGKPPRRGGQSFR